METDFFRPETEVFNDSLARCLHGDRLFQRFLELFLTSSEEVRAKFHGTDLAKQRRMLQSSFYMLLEYIGVASLESRTFLERIAHEHSKHGRDIPPHLYDLWLDCLLRAVKECDPRYSPEVEAAWRYMMEAGIAFLKSRYDGAVDGNEPPTRAGSAPG